MGLVKQIALVFVFALTCVNCSIKGAPEDSNNTQASTNPDPPKTCLATEVLYQNQCFAQYLSCTSGGGTGKQEFYNGSYGSCVVNSCPASTHLESGVCMANVKACAFANGTGQQQWTGTGYGACTLVSCNNEYRQDGAACIGPIVNLYRFYNSPTGNGLADHHFSPTNTSPVPGATAEGIQLILFKTQQAGTIPLYQCDVKPDSGYFIFYQNSQCEYGGTPAILGYMPTSAQGGANKAIYYEPMSAASYGITTTNTAELRAGAAIIGYSF